MCRWQANLCPMDKSSVCVFSAVGLRSVQPGCSLWLLPLRSTTSWLAQLKGVLLLNYAIKVTPYIRGQISNGRSPYICRRWSTNQCTLCRDGVLVCVLHKDADGRMVRSSQNMAGRFQRASTRVTNVTDFVGRCVMSIATGLASTPSNLYSKNNAN
jgi:hypothetical protein